MSRDLESEIDSLKTQVEAILGRLDAGPRLEAGLHGKGAERAMDLANRAKDAGSKGAIEYYGAYQSDNQGYLRHQEYLGVEKLLELDLEDVAKVLFAVANRQRLAVLALILEKPRTANELVELLGFGTTGQAYHHLKALQSADFVTVEDGGCYAFRPHRVHGFLMILAGVHDTLDRQYTAGNLGELANVPGEPQAARG